MSLLVADAKYTLLQNIKRLIRAKIIIPNIIYITLTMHDFTITITTAATTLTRQHTILIIGVLNHCTQCLPAPPQAEFFCRSGQRHLTSP